MAIEKRNISISFGQGIDTKTDPNQVMAGKPIALTNATLSETLALKKRNGYQPIVSFNASIASSSLNNQKLAVFNNQLVTLDGKTLSSLGNSKNILIDNFIAVQPSVSIIQREATPIINQDAAYNSGTQNTAYTWSSSCIAPNVQQLSFSGATGKFQLTAPNGTVLASTGIFGFVKNKVFSFGSNLIWTGINYATSALAYYKLAANGTSANFTQIAIGSVGGDFPVNTNTLGFNRYQRYDGAVLGDNLYLAWFTPATSSVTVSLLTNSGVTASTSLAVDASGALSIFGDKDLAWITYHDGASSAGFAVLSTSSLQFLGGPNPWFTTDTPSSTNQVSIPQAFTGVSKGFSANVYTQWLNYYPPLQAPGILPWPSAQRSDFISRQSLTHLATSGSSAVVIRSVGLSSKAWNYLGDDYLLSSYGIQTSSSADRLEPTYFVLSPTKKTNKVIGKLAFENACGYDFATGGQGNFLNNNFGSVGYGLPLPNVTTNNVNSQFVIPYLIKTGAVPLSSTSLVDRFFINFNYGLNASTFDFNAPTLYSAKAFGNNLNIAGGYLASFDGKSTTEHNFHLFPEDIQLLGSSSFGPPANTYAYQVLYESQDAQGNIFRSAPSRTYSITTGGSSAIYLSIPTLRVTNRQNTVIRVYRNAPTIDTLTFHDISPLMPALNNPGIDNVVVIDTNLDTSIVGNPDIYTTGGVLEDTGAPSPRWISTYKLRIMMTDAENPNVIWYSKEVVPGAPIEMSDLQTFPVKSDYGAVICHLEMDDKFIIFTSNADGVGAIYYMTGQGPSITGSSNDFSVPTLLTTTLTTNNPNSVILTPDGIMFSSEKGIWVLGHNLETQYIGAAVEAYHTDSVTSATLIPDTTEVRFTLNSGRCLVWDYFQRQWSTFSNIKATHGLIYQGLFTYVSAQNQSMTLLQETPGFFADLNTPILISTTLSWLSFAGLQGYQRAYRLYVMSKYKSSHLLAVSLAYDFNDSVVQTAVITPVQNKNQAYGSDPFWGSTKSWGGQTNPNQRVNFTRQKCQSLQITLQELVNPGSMDVGAGLILENIGVVVGGKLSYPKLPPQLSVK